MKKDAAPQSLLYYGYKTQDEFRQAWEKYQQAAESAKRRDEWIERALIQYVTGMPVQSVIAIPVPSAARTPAQSVAGTGVPPVAATPAESVSATSVESISTSPAESVTATPAQSVAAPPVQSGRRGRAVPCPIGTEWVREYLRTHDVPCKDRKSHFGLGATSIDTAFNGGSLKRESWAKLAKKAGSSIDVWLPLSAN
jgi:hypothetical protein